MDFVEICNVSARKAIIKAAKRIFNYDKICCSYCICDFYFGVTFLEHSVIYNIVPFFRSLPSDELIDWYSGLSVHPSVRTSIRPSVRPQKVFPILIYFGVWVVLDWICAPV